MGKFPNIAAMQEAVTAAGFAWRKVGPDHLQITGGVRIVNYYPFAKGGATIYVQGMAGSTKGDISAAIAAARKGHGFSDKQHKRHKSERSRRNALLVKDPNCHWCRTPLTALTATLDHVVALSKGGGQGSDNVVLACQSCNAGRANRVTRDELKTLGAKPFCGQPEDSCQKL